ncbi:MAG TPA: hypothetical protein ENN40_11700 [Candidatus Aminicenantes bacterium]|nr:hypothetical protein [Candidatus Aminicenantes bacterium]
MNKCAYGDGDVAAAWLWNGASVRVRTSSNKGATWTAEKGFLAQAGGKPGFLKLTYDDLGNLMIAWVEDGVIFFRRSINNGATWSAPTEVTTQAVNPDNYYPLGLVASADNRILVSWVKNRTMFMSTGSAE